MNRAFLAIGTCMMLLVASGCVQEEKKSGLTENEKPAANTTNPSPAANTTSPAQATNATAPAPQDRLSVASAQLLEVNKRFLAQTKEAEAAAGELNFTSAAELFNLSSRSGRNLTILLDEVCRLKGKNCSTQLEGYANIAVCARARGDFYHEMDGMMPIILLRLNCTNMDNSTATAADKARCQSNDADYINSCSVLRQQAGLTEAICQSVMSHVNTWQASDLICNEAK